ncbi:hypothetical protein PCANC_24189 [Puccinia coronata f. sp. avenae]|uniref:Uncharacterized protein n=1 Tax=Puccinia coronata f. sp. avenae TaxID=200324 RepID=A0A2N5S8F1_9BASI|nr:hypothetical protein PCANC_24189 [Puccinia coronata f. sp. avenae]
MVAGASLVDKRHQGSSGCCSQPKRAGPTCSPSWYQPSEQAYLLAKLVPAQQAGPTCSPSWYQPSGQVLLLTTGLSGLPGGARTPLDDRDRRVIKRRKTTLDDRYRPVIKRRRTGHQEEDASSRWPAQSGHQGEACSS